jgi:hypothetical protein
VWLSVDPLASDAPYLTPYRFSFNNPLNVVDPNGMFETDYLNTETGEKIHIEDGIDQTIELVESSGGLLEGTRGMLKAVYWVLSIIITPPFIRKLKQTTPVIGLHTPL